MRRTHKLGVLLAWWLLGATALATTALVVHDGGGEAAAGPAPRPMIFIHGFVGSGGQFESQAMRFTSNGYPANYIRVHEYDSVFGLETQAQVLDRLDVLIADLQAETGATQVDLLGHSLGTALSQSYLSTPARAAKVAHYVNLDGGTAAAQPGGVPTLAVWGRGNPARQIVGATNVYFPEQTHVEVADSAETFGEIYPFFTGEEPEFAHIVRQPAGELQVGGRVTTFISNAGVDDATLRIFEVDGATGHRLDDVAEATFPLSGDSSWGPFAADPDRFYELALNRNGQPSTQHFYLQQFVRSNHLLRLLTAEPNTGIDLLWEKSPDHSNLTIQRNKEWWGDQGAANDVLTIDGTNILSPVIAPIDKRAIGIFAFDLGSDGTTDLSAPVPAFAGLPFITGVDVNMAATTPPDGTVEVASTPRLGGGQVVTINVPNWASTTDRVSLQFSDFVTTLDPPVAPSSTTSSTASTSTSIAPTSTGSLTPSTVRPLATASPATATPVTPRFTG